MKHICNVDKTIFRKLDQPISFFCSSYQLHNRNCADRDQPCCLQSEGNLLHHPAPLLLHSLQRGAGRLRQRRAPALLPPATPLVLPRLGAVGRGERVQVDGAPAALAHLPAVGGHSAAAPPLPGPAAQHAPAPASLQGPHAAPQPRAVAYGAHQLRQHWRQRAQWHL